MRCAKLILLLFFILIIPEFNFSGQNQQYPPGIKWRILIGNNFNIVFPSGRKKSAIRIFGYLESNFKEIYKDLIPGKEKFTIFLNDRSSLSNGFIKLAPKMGEFNLTPPQSMFAGNSEWLKTLSLHEGRHTAQFAFLNRGFTKIAGTIFGELGRGTMSLWSVPQWFWEGDAVRTETKLSGGGRGRSAFFNLGLRALLLNNRNYNYQKSYLSSYKDFVPSIYTLGYFLTSYIAGKYPDGTIGKILLRSSKYSFYPLIFGESLRKETGKGIKTIFRESMDDLKFFFKSTFNKIGQTGFSILSPKHRVWTFYSSPRIDKNGIIYAQKFSLSRSLRIVSIDTKGVESHLFYINPPDHKNNVFSVKRGKISWSESRPDLRWGKEDFSEIMIFDIKKQKKKRLTKRSRFFSPALSNNGNNIAAVEIGRSGKHKLIFLDSRSGKVMSKYLPEAESRISFPSWSDDDKTIVLIEQKDEKKRITLFEIMKGNFKGVTPYSYENLQTPIFFNKRIFYVSDINGIDTIWSIDPDSGEKRVEVSPLFGAYYPCIDISNNRLIYCDYNIEGSRIVQTPVNKNRNYGNPGIIKDYSYYSPGKEWKNKATPPVKKKREEKPVIKKYNHLKGLFNFHSRIIDPSLPEPSLTFMSDNKLNSMSIRTGVSYNTNEKGKRIFLNGIYSGLFPVINLSASIADRSNGGSDPLTWKEKKISLGFKIPLNLSTGSSLKKLSISSELSFINFSRFNLNSADADGNTISASFKLNYSSFRYTALRDIIPPGGFLFSLHYIQTPFNEKYRGSLFSLSGGLIIKGIKVNQQFLFRAGYEKQNPVNYIFTSDLIYPRGYSYTFSHSLFTASADYIFPISYPDFAIGELIYIKRIRGNIFFDFAAIADEGPYSHISSAGSELLFDFNLFTIPIELFGGIRLSYRFNDRSFSFIPIFFRIGFN